MLSVLERGSADSPLDCLRFSFFFLQFGTKAEMTLALTVKIE